MIVRPQATTLANSSVAYPISTGQQMGITGAQFRIGSVLYPQSKIAYSNNNKGEVYNEIRKCFGTIGSYNHGTMLNDATFHAAAADTVGTGDAGGVRSLWMLAYDFETFAKSATESGINVSDRALPVNLELDIEATNNAATRFDIFAMSDCIIYIDLMGRVSTRI